MYVMGGWVVERVGGEGMVGCVGEVGMSDEEVGGGLEGKGMFGRDRVCEGGGVKE